MAARRRSRPGRHPSSQCQHPSRHPPSDPPRARRTARPPLASRASACRRPEASRWSRAWTSPCGRPMAGRLPC
eukprot:9473423-Pyramimonas_sp.AAC.1